MTVQVTSSTPPSTTALLAELEDLRHASFQTKQSDSEHLCQYITTLNSELTALAQGVIGPLASIRGEVLVAVTVPTSSDVAKFGLDENISGDPKKLPALEVVPHTHFARALRDSLKSFVDTQERTLSTLRGDNDNNTSSPFLDRTPRQLKLTIVDDKESQYGWMLLDLTDLAAGAQLCEFSRPKDENGSNYDSFLQLFKDRETVDSLRKLGVSSHLFRDRSLEKLYEELDKVLLFSRLFEVASQDCPVLTELKNSPHELARLMLAAGCADLFGRPFVRSGGQSREASRLSPEMLLKHARLVATTLPKKTSSPKLSDSVLGTAFSVDPQSWHFSAKKCSTPVYPSAILEKFISIESQDKATTLAVQIFYKDLLGDQIVGVEVALSTQEQGTNSMKYHPTIPDCFENRVLAQLLTYYSKNY
jgi:hypothetical protein